MNQFIKQIKLMAKRPWSEIGKSLTIFVVITVAVIIAINFIPAGTCLGYCRM